MFFTKKKLMSGPRFERGPSGHEPDELPLLHPNIINNNSCLDDYKVLNYFNKKFFKLVFLPTPLLIKITNFIFD